MGFPKIEGFVVTEKLGSGSYSTVYKAYTKVGARTVVAIKCVDKARVKHSGSAVDNLITEIRLLKTLRHPHIVHMRDFTWDDRNIYIIMEYCCGGDLSKYIHRYGRVPEKQVLYFLQQLVSALKFLREKGVAHMDLKPHNLLLHKDSDGKYILKVADFGFAAYMSDGDAGGGGVRGSPLYMAPEMLRSPPAAYDARVDLWSLGVIMYECLFGKAPYSSGTFKELIDKIQAQQPIQIPPNSSISGGCRSLLTRLLQHDPRRRISHEELFELPYLDLDHMPTRENYHKAVRLLRDAVRADSAGDLGAALEGYCAALRYLVPAVGGEGDAVRRAALRDKVVRYMERAEELKRFTDLESGAIPVPAPPAASAAHANNAPDSRMSPLGQMSSCCVGATVSHHYAGFDDMVEDAESKEVYSYGGGRGGEQENEAGKNVNDRQTDRGAGLFDLRRRFFGKRTTTLDVPALEAEPGANNIEREGKKRGGAAVGDPVGDGCRIS